MTTGPRALLITGAVGVGKTTVTDAVGEELAAQGVAGAAIDLDWLRRSWPAPDDDPFQSRLELENLRLVAGTYRAAGALVLVAAGVLEAREDRPAYEVACGCPLTVVRLTAPRDLVRERLHRRHDLDPGGLVWHLERYDELTAVLDDAGVEDVGVAIREDPRATARAVLDAVGI
ncbi:hypothetical protein BH708_17105 [Brachybacterium sp. P6-10-X1]|uniref:AAA family ATPase n=1 Tax=Brachybacterium sp. P6-10-X1 TaxID=1903186 RepID=UPI000971A432|nr:AAA family ATPase [Brachybacterium sp. P6-10-X1]APX34137.1 hypothetical protein BH708_17105 [Brachybacterium sp. P6-10-X1]